MASEYGECFVVLQPFAEGGGAIYGRNSYAARNEVTEVLYFPATEDSAPRKVTRSPFNTLQLPLTDDVSISALVWRLRALLRGL